MSTMSQSRLAYKLKSMAAVVGGAAVGFLGVAAASGNPDFYRDVAMPFVHRIMSPESAHRMAILAARWQLVRGQRKPDPPVLRTELFGLSFENPVGLAAGFDKHGEGVGGLERWGFGFVEVGSVTPLPQPGNPKPRVFRLAEDLAVINRYGFNSVGHDQVLSSLEAGRHGWKRPVGVNLGKNKESASAADDYAQGVLKFGELADYLVINVSSPNTPGLRGLQGQRELRQLLKQVLGARDSLSKRTPVLVKVAPDLSDQEKADIAAVVTSKECRVDGLVVCNTTVGRPPELHSEHRHQAGGLSGRPLTDLSTRTIADMYRLTKGSVPIIGVGGVLTGEDAYAKVKAGASLLQMYSALVFYGPPAVCTVKERLAELLSKDGYTTIADAVGADHRK